jgi:hypothetical protein
VSVAILDGTHCRFDTALNEARGDFAEALVEYGDRKIPELFAALGFDPEGHQIQLEFGNDPGGRYVGDWTVRFGRDHAMNDMGCLIHEVVHVAQEPGVWPLYNSDHLHRFLIEGIADYYRITLSDDRQGDYFNDSKKKIHPNFSHEWLYESGPEFVAYLRRRSGNANFVRLLNDRVRANDAAGIDQLCVDTCGHSVELLLNTYPATRLHHLGPRHWFLRRYTFFTEMPPAQ